MRVRDVEIKNCSVNARERQTAHGGDRNAFTSNDDNYDDDDDDNGDGDGDGSISSVLRSCIGISCGAPGGTVHGQVIDSTVKHCQIGILNRDASAISVLSCAVAGCSDAGIVSRDSSSGSMKNCRVTHSEIGVVLQGMSGGKVESVRVHSCAVGVLVHKKGVGSVENVQVEDCVKGLVIAKDGGGLIFRSMVVKGGTCGVAISAVCKLTGFRVENCKEEGFRRERPGRVVFQV